MPVYKLLGFLFVLLAAIGVFLPLLPTTPFVLLAAGCFAKSSPYWHQWLVSSKLFGPFLSNWEQHHCITVRTRFVAISSIIIFGGFSMFFAISNPLMHLISGVLLMIGLIVVCRLKVCNEEGGNKEAPLPKKGEG